MAEVETKKLDVNNLAPGVVLSRNVIEMENKMPDTKGFISTPEFNRLTKIRFDPKIKEETKRLTINSHVDTSFDVFYILMTQGFFLTMDHIIISWLNRLLILSEFQLVILKQS